MPEFCHSFSGLACDRMLTPHELVRAVRFMVAAEYEAIQLYEQLSESTDNPLARRVLLDIADEEKEHVGEFQRLLSILAPQDEPFYQEGREETDKNLSGMAVQADGTSCCGVTGAEEPGCADHEAPREGCPTVAPVKPER